jgi:hypothetical protein
MPASVPSLSSARLTSCRSKKIFIASKHVVRRSADGADVADGSFKAPAYSDHSRPRPAFA